MNFEFIKGRYFAFIFFLLLIVLPLNVSALTIDSGYFGFGDVWVYYDKTDNQTADGAYFGSGTGMLQVNYNGYDTWAFCIDLGAKVAIGDNDIIGTIEIADNYLYVEWLADTYADDLFVSAGSGVDISYESAALQLAIWEVLYDNSSSWDVNYLFGEGTGFFSYNRDQSTELNNIYDTYIKSLISAVSNTNLWNDWVSSISEGEYIVLELSQNGVDTQDIIVNVVPEPTTALLLGFGLLGLCAVGRKKD